MNMAGYLRLLFLAAVWGSSFLFMRLAVPVVGAGTVVFSRLVLASVFLTVVCRLAGQPLLWRQYWRNYLLLGLLNTGLPFLLFGLAAERLPAGLLSILNATTTLWGTVVGAIWARSGLTPLTVAGLALGFLGVAGLAGLDPAAVQQGAPVAILCGLTATLCYGLGATATRFGPKIPPLATAQGSVGAATLMVLPVLWLDPPHMVPGPTVLAALLALGLLCSGVAYMIYFDLLARYRAQQVLSVAFLIPLFGLLWGCLFLGEQVGWSTLWGGAAVLGGTALVNRAQRT